MTAGTMASSRVTIRRSQGGSRMSQEALHHDLAGEGRGDGRILARGEQRDREQRARRCRRRASASAAGRRPGSRRRRCGRRRGRSTAARIRIAELMNKREHQRDGAVDGGVFDRLAPCRRGVSLEGAGLHHRGVEIEVVRHHGRAEDADRDVEHRRIGDDLGRRSIARQRPRRCRAATARARRRSSRR